MYFVEVSVFFTVAAVIVGSVNSCSDEDITNKTQQCIQSAVGEIFKNDATTKASIENMAKQFMAGMGEDTSADDKKAALSKLIDVGVCGSLKPLIETALTCVSTAIKECPNTMQAAMVGKFINLDRLADAFDKICDHLDVIFSAEAMACLSNKMQEVQSCAAQQSGGAQGSTGPSDEQICTMFDAGLSTCLPLTSSCGAEMPGALREIVEVLEPARCSGCVLVATVTTAVIAVLFSWLLA